MRHLRPLNFLTRANLKQWTPHTIFVLVIKCYLTKLFHSTPKPREPPDIQNPRRKPFPKAKIMVLLVFLVLDFGFSYSESFPPPNFEILFYFRRKKNIQFLQVFSWRIMSLLLLPLLACSPFSGQYHNSINSMSLMIQKQLPKGDWNVRSTHRQSRSWQRDQEQQHLGDYSL